MKPPKPPPAREYAYRPSWSKVLGAWAFFAIAAVFLGYKATADRGGRGVNGASELAAGGAAVFYWILFVLSVGFVIAGFLLVYHRLTYRQRLVFGEAKMAGPRSRWSREETEIAYEDISGLMRVEVSGQHFLHVHHAGGKYTINAAMLASLDTLEEIDAFLAAKLDANAVAAGVCVGTARG